MNILIAPNSMKESLSAFRFADLVGQAFLDIDSSFFKIRKVPVADGGDDTAGVLIKALNLKNYKIEVFDPLRRTISASLGYGNEHAIIELANASGMKLMNKTGINPLISTTYGTGQMISEALKLGAKTIYIGIGGSATVDGGTGILEALGLEFYNSFGAILTANGGNLKEIKSIGGNLSLPDDIKIIVICDVENPLIGENGAVYVFAPQKGATPEMVEVLEIGLRNFADVTYEFTGKSITALKGGGAAGGTAAGLAAYLNAEIVSGADFILDKLSFDEHVQWADLVITGEGKIDNQTFWNKAPYAVASRAKKYGKKVIGIAGSIEYQAEPFFDGVFSFIDGPCSLEQSINNADRLVYNATKELAKFIRSMIGADKNFT
jgi:glycerate kinase